MPTRGDVWLIDLGLVGKVRPGVVLSVPADTDDDRALVTLVPHTTSLRGSRFEVLTSERFLKTSAFNVQGLVSAPRAKLIRRLGKLSPETLAEVERAVRTWLGL